MNKDQSTKAAQIRSSWANLEEAIAHVGDGQVGQEMIDLMSRLFPICRSITGDGVRETLSILGERAGLNIQEVSTGYKAFDWTVPREWNIRDAYIKNEGEQVVGEER